MNTEQMNQYWKESLVAQRSKLTAIEAKMEAIPGGRENYHQYELLRSSKNEIENSIAFLIRKLAGDKN